MCYGPRVEAGARMGSIIERDSGGQPGEGRLAQRKARTRAAILEAAERLFHDQGFDETSIQQIAELAETGVGTVYGYFTSKEAMLREVLRGHSEEAVDRYRAAISDTTPPLECLSLALGTYAGFIREHRPVLRAAFHRALSRPPEDHPTGWLLGSFRALLDEGVARGQFRQLPIDATCRTLLGTVMMAMLGIGIWRGREDDPATIDDLLELTKLLVLF